MNAPPDNGLTRRIIGCAIEVHRHLGPGLLESVYEACMYDELTSVGLPFLSQRSFPVRYKDPALDQHFKVDIIVADTVILEIKAVHVIHPLHEAQRLT